MIAGEVDLRSLDDVLLGSVVLPENGEYDGLRRVWNLLFDRRPAAVVRCAGVSDVVAALRFARENELPFTIRGGGHCVDGTAVADGALLLDLGGMSGVVVDPRSRVARVQAGATLGVVDRETQLHGLAVPSGIVSDTGVAGLTLGGGIGWLTRRFGATVDNLVGIDGVTVEGRVVRADERENEDLFWAMRGGGGNFAIATAFDFRAHPLETVVAGTIMHPGDRANEAVRIWREFMAGAPDELASTLVLTRTPDDPNLPASVRGGPVVVFVVAWSGELSQTDEALRPLREWGPPAVDAVEQMSYLDLQTMTEKATVLTGLRVYETGTYTTLTDGFLDAAVSAGASAPDPDPTTGAHYLIALEYLGGAMARVPDDAMAFNRVNTDCFCAIVAAWADPEGDDAGRTWNLETLSTLRAHASPETYRNITIETDDPLVQKAFSPAKYRRLAEIKRKWDPENVLRFNKNIPPA